MTKLGGQGIAVACDHANDAEVEALFQQVQQEQGELHLLVNNATATPAGGMPRGVPFWELPIAVWDQLHTVGLRSHYVASRYAMPLFLARGGGLIVNISSAGAMRYTFNVPYGVGKAALDRLTADMAQELQPHHVAAASWTSSPARRHQPSREPERDGWISHVDSREPRSCFEWPALANLKPKMAGIVELGVPQLRIGPLGSRLEGT